MLWFLSSDCIGLFFVALLFGSILAKGLPAFWQSSMSVPVYFDPKVLMQVQNRYSVQGETPAHYEERYVDWQTKMGMVDWDSFDREWHDCKRSSTCITTR